MAYALLQPNADMVSVLGPAMLHESWTSRAIRAFGAALLPAAFLILITGRPTEAQQIDLLASAARSLAAQSGDQQQLNLSATGCPSTTEPARTAITFEDEHHNAWYRATYKGQHLKSGHGVHIIGALLPTWNLAAQMGSEGGTAPGNVFNAIAWTLPNPQIGANPYRTPRMRLAWVPTALTGPCPTP